MLLIVFSVDDLTLVADDKEADAFGPVAKDMKIKNLRAYLFINTFSVLYRYKTKCFLNFFIMILLINIHLSGNTYVLLLVKLLNCLC